MSIESGDIYAHHEIATVIHYAIFEASKGLCSLDLP